MMVVLLLTVAAAISVGYLSVVAEAGMRKLHEVQAVRRVVEAVFLFPLIEALTSRATAQESKKIFGIPRLVSSFNWSSGFRWVAVAAVLAGMAWWLSLSLLDSSLDVLLYIVVVAVVVLFLWQTIGRPRPR